jgi:hypothetical protein
MSETRESRRQRVERLGSLPDAQIKILWGKLWANVLGITVMLGSTAVLVELMYRAAGL